MIQTLFGSVEQEPSLLEKLKSGVQKTRAGLVSAVDDLLQGKKGPFRDVALLNAAAPLLVAGRAPDIEGGILLAKKSIDSGEAEGRLGRLIAISND